ncbi:MAG: hypothetical protein JWM20_62 [Patescibacteria group bacterium]|nr:hypothetical protein [Patescibacteria group bacterium]
MNEDENQLESQHLDPDFDFLLPSLNTRQLRLTQHIVNQDKNNPDRFLIDFKPEEQAKGIMIVDHSMGRTLVMHMLGVMAEKLVHDTPMLIVHDPHHEGIQKGSDHFLYDGLIREIDIRMLKLDLPEIEESLRIIFDEPIVKSVVPKRTPLIEKVFAKQKDIREKFKPPW